MRLRMEAGAAPAAGAGKGKGKGKGANMPLRKDQDGLFVTDGQSKQVCFCSPRAARVRSPARILGHTSASTVLVRTQIAGRRSD